MPANSPSLTESSAAALAAIGTAVRARRKALRISATAAAEAAGISRVTLHRIEKGEASVTIGAYLAVCTVLGLQARVVPRNAGEPAAAGKGWLPARVRIADYPKLAELAWQLHGTTELTPREALDIYERNRKHVDEGALGEAERDLLDALRTAVGDTVRV